ncbi:MAG: hydroxymethylbilane synthase [Candidatus Rokubacteria bacterium]|nr:hydroxymethylbilane synthase [Candidatus Rokubacteria bacterium]
MSAGAIRVGTRESPLALRQATLLADRVRELAPERAVELVPMKTSGDRLGQVALGSLGGKGLFVKELEEAVIAGRVDLAVHSLKDLPAALPDGLCLAAFLPRADPRDVLVSRTGAGIGDLPRGARVGTSSLRRRVLLLSVRPDLKIETIRGNVDTRLRRLTEGAYDAIVLAAAGLERLGLGLEHARPLDPDQFIPAVGQGILAVEARADDRRLLELLGRLDHHGTRRQAEAERAFLRHLGASCHTPVAGHARLADGELILTGLVASVDGRQVLRGQTTGVAENAELIGQKLAEELMARGARAILGEIAEKMK